MKAPDRLPVGTAIYACPLPECLWSISESLVADVEFRVNPEVVARSMTSGPYQEAARENVEVAINQVAFECAETIEKEIRAHLESHDVLDFVRAIRSLEQELAQRQAWDRAGRHDLDRPVPEIR